MKIWDKGFDNDARVDAFTVGKDRELDLLLAPYDIEGTMAHITMLSEVGLLPKEDLNALLPELEKLRQEALEGRFVIHGEDVHSEVEERLGPLGKKVHTGRSRNDQVALDIKLFTRARIRSTVEKVSLLFDILVSRADELKDVFMPGYTHLQVAMPSSFGLWLGAYAECLCDDLLLLESAWEINGRNPLGSAAGYGSSAPLDRRRTTQLLGMPSLAVNSIYAQMARGRSERTVAYAYSSVAETLGRLATDCCLFASQNFGFVHLPDAFTTGSSIMPQKKKLVTGNLPSGYFRDMQVLKEIYLPLFDELDACLDILILAMPSLEVARDLASDPLYATAYCVEEVNRLVEAGVPFRDAYRTVGKAVQEGTFHFDGELRRTHVGSSSNLCLDEVVARFQKGLSLFGFEK